MANQFRHFRKPSSAYLSIAGAVLVVAVALTLVTCGSNVQVSSNPPVGTINVSISDPPSCRIPEGEFAHVYITVRSVQAHLSSAATPSTAGWQELAPQLVTKPRQIDLLSHTQNTCILARLGSNSSLPVGDYQQIRLILLSNSPASGSPLPDSNACGSGGFNCAVMKDGSTNILQLSSEANTGLKIPPGQILGGPIRVEAGQSVDLNIDFNVCASIVLQGNGLMRLRPALTAGAVSQNTTAISGQIVDNTTMLPINGSVLVALEQQIDTPGVDRIVMQAAADSNGNFNFCPLAPGMYDVVAVALRGDGVAYNASAVLNVPAGTALGKILLFPEGSTLPPAGPATITGTVTAASGGSGANVNVTVSALQILTLPGTPPTTRQITIPLLSGSTSNVATEPGGLCPAGTNCKNYTLMVPASNPAFVLFPTAGTSLTAPTGTDVFYTVDARAFSVATPSQPICSPSELTTDKDSADQPLKVTGGGAVTAKRLDFTGCS